MMTREEAIAYFEARGNYNPHDGTNREAEKMALSALRPVSREQVERMRGEWIGDNDERVETMIIAASVWIGAIRNPTAARRRERHEFFQAMQMWIASKLELIFWWGLLPKLRTDFGRWPARWRERRTHENEHGIPLHLL